MNYSYNPYFSNNQNYGMYQPTYQSMMQNSMAQQNVAQQNQQVNQNSQSNTQYDKQIQDVRFVSEKDAHDYILLPNTRVMLIDRDNSVFYIKSADSLGTQTMEAYKFSKFKENATNSLSSLDTQDFVKKDDMKEFLSGFITRDDIKNFITKDELKVFDNKLDAFQKQIVGEMLKGDSRNGKQSNNH